MRLCLSVNVFTDIGLAELTRVECEVRVVVGLARRVSSLGNPDYNPDSIFISILRMCKPVLLRTRHERRTDIVTSPRGTVDAASSDDSGSKQRSCFSFH